ncbi:redox-regulated ATPase YchF [Candidatus Uhrbacteria bacterium]|nr:redox-regulated ATPase YchF [Candidatus Uhrbacteria bacterium]
MNIGIVGLPNVGKSTLFKALTKKQVDIANYPFCTIDPNVGVVKVPDERLARLAELSHSAKIVPTSIEFVDIAGLVKGASQGEGLGNKFLSHIREVDAIAHVVRVFHDKNIIHVAGEPKPIEDIDVINLELIFADMATLEKRIGATKSQMKSGKTRILEEQLCIYEKVYTCLESGAPANRLDLSDEEKETTRDLHLLTLKPFLYVLNVDEEMGSCSVSRRESAPDLISEIEQRLAGYTIVALCAQAEADMADLSDEEVRELGMKRTGLDTFITVAYKLLDLITFLTTGPDETRAWTIRNGTKAPQAAGVIHTDFEKGFIRAETINWKDLVDAGGEVAAKEKGLIRLEGKEYIVRDGDVMVFRFSV